MEGTNAKWVLSFSHTQTFNQLVFGIGPKIGMVIVWIYYKIIFYPKKIFFLTDELTIWIITFLYLNISFLSENCLSLVEKKMSSFNLFFMASD